MEDGDARIARLRIKAEAIQVSLKTFPSRKDYAHGLLIESKIPKIQKMTSEISPLVEDANKKAVAAIEASKKLLTCLEKFDELGVEELFGLNRNFVATGLNNIQYLGSFGMSGVVGNAQKIDLEIVLLDMVYDNKKLEGWVEQAKDSIFKKINVISEHARRLKGE